MLGEKFSHLGLDRLRQQRARPVAQNLGERVGKRPWLKQLDHGSIGHGVSLLCWRSGGSDTPTIRRLLPVRPSPTSANSSVSYLESYRSSSFHSTAIAVPRALVSIRHRVLNCRDDYGGRHSTTRRRLPSALRSRRSGGPDRHH